MLLFNNLFHTNISCIDTVLFNLELLKMLNVIEERTLTTTTTTDNKCRSCVQFTTHFFCKNTRQSIASAVSFICIIGLVVTTIITSAFHPWLPIAFMSILFVSCMGLFCCNKPRPAQRQEIYRFQNDRQYVMRAFLTSQQETGK